MDMDVKLVCLLTLHAPGVYVPRMTIRRVGHTPLIIIVFGVDFTPEAGNNPLRKLECSELRGMLFAREVDLTLR
ncbi:hypothetical protein ONZ45_g5781 [Pleurotus djamor]|nr:hypothetical protein ONZ45_g5781 [Pleurotus djamor]